MPDLPEHPYPLCWPPEMKRRATRERSSFRTDLPKAIKNVQDSLRLFAQDSGRALKQVQVTSNVGLMQAKPADPGVAVWFIWDDAVRCIAVDRYLTVQENLQAIHHVLEARRVELRHAGIELARAAFKGFTLALPAPGKQWWEVLGVSPEANAAQIQTAYRAKAREAAERRDDAALQELNVARDKAMGNTSA